MRIATSAMALLGCMLATPADASIQYIGSEIYASARADVDAITVATPANDINAKFSPLLPTGGVSVQSVVDKVADGGSAHAYQYVGFEANSPVSGLFSMDGAISTSLVSPANATAQALIGGTAYYRFDTTTPVFLDLNYSISGTQNSAIDPSTAFNVAVAFYNSTYVYDQNLSGTGSTRILLQPGDYDIFTGISTDLSGKPTFINANGIGNRSNTYDGVLGFTMTATTPEPASWVMMILGLGFVGAMKRRSIGPRFGRA